MMCLYKANNVCTKLCVYLNIYIYIYTVYIYAMQTCTICISCCVVFIPSTIIISEFCKNLGDFSCTSERATWSQRSPCFTCPTAPLHRWFIGETVDSPMPSCSFCAGVHAKALIQARIYTHGYPTFHTAQRVRL